MICFDAFRFSRKSQAIRPGQVGATALLLVGLRLVVAGCLQVPPLARLRTRPLVRVPVLPQMANRGRTHNRARGEIGVSRTQKIGVTGFRPIG